MKHCIAIERVEGTVCCCFVRVIFHNKTLCFSPFTSVPLIRQVGITFLLSSSSEELSSAAVRMWLLPLKVLEPLSGQWSPPHHHHPPPSPWTCPDTVSSRTDTSSSSQPPKPPSATDSGHRFFQADGLVWEDTSLHAILLHVILLQASSQ